MTTNQVLRQFMGKMDKLWKTYDEAVDKLPNSDAFAFKRYSEYLDKFFVCYWAVFDLAVDAQTDEVLRLSDAQHEESVRILELTWRNTTDALLRRATQLKESKARARSLPALLSTFQKAERLLNEIRKDSIIMKRVAGHIEAADILEQFIRRLESAN